MKKELDSIILTRQELEIMKVVWQRGSATVREVRDVIAQSKPTAYTTILTLMNILETKGVLTHGREGRAYVYQPLLTREQAVQNQLRDVVERFFSGDSERLVGSLLDKGWFSNDQLSRLRGLFDDRLQSDAA
jgi:BlaI family transcriptional regulator, penicillinase repressor